MTEKPGCADALVLACNGNRGTGRGDTIGRLGCTASARIGGIGCSAADAIGLIRVGRSLDAVHGATTSVLVVVVIAALLVIPPATVIAASAMVSTATKATAIVHTEEGRTTGRDGAKCFAIHLTFRFPVNTLISSA